MPDWQQIVSSKLSGLALEPEEVTQVLEEVAGHLEEEYQSLLSKDVPEKEAARRALRRVDDWQALKQMIESARKKENPMPKRVAQFWLPAFLTLLLSMVLLAVIQMFGPNPWTRVVASRWWMPVAVVYVSWLLFLPLIGALGAYMSRRAGGSARAVFFSIVFPTLPYLTFFLIGLPIALILDDRVAHNITIPAFFVGLSAWVIFPAAALLAGGWPVHFFASRRLISSRSAGG
ncbi:MAG TPA: hypothetical protein VF863_00475 [Candidatus Acidoferrum sp.]